MAPTIKPHIDWLLSLWYMTYFISSNNTFYMAMLAPTPCHTQLGTPYNLTCTCPTTRIDLVNNVYCSVILFELDHLNAQHQLCPCVIDSLIQISKMQSKKSGKSSPYIKMKRASSTRRRRVILIWREQSWHKDPITS